MHGLCFHFQHIDFNQPVVRMAGVQKLRTRMQTQSIAHTASQSHVSRALPILVFADIADTADIFLPIRVPTFPIPIFFGR